MTTLRRLNGRRAFPGSSTRTPRVTLSSISSYPLQRTSDPLWFIDRHAQRPAERDARRDREMIVYGTSLCKVQLPIFKDILRPNFPYIDCYATSVRRVPNASVSGPIFAIEFTGEAVGDDVYNRSAVHSRGYRIHQRQDGRFLHDLRFERSISYRQRRRRTVTMSGAAPRHRS